MSKSMKRVRAALDAAGLTAEIVETPLARTAADAATALGVAVDQIAKSIIFRGEDSGAAVLFLTAGGNRVDVARAADLAGEPLGKADATLVRAQTGFAIGGVSPVGHLNPIRAWIDPRLMEFDLVWAAAGTPHHVFPATPAQLQALTSAPTADCWRTTDLSANIGRGREFPEEGGCEKYQGLGGLTPAGSHAKHVFTNTL